MVHSYLHEVLHRMKNQKHVIFILYYLIEVSFFCIKSSHLQVIILNYRWLQDEKTFTKAWHYLFYHIVLHRNIYDVIFASFFDEFES